MARGGQEFDSLSMLLRLWLAISLVIFILSVLCGNKNSEVVSFEIFSIGIVGIILKGVMP